jgi:Putative peptidoglycan binding domain
LRTIDSRLVALAVAGVLVGGALSGCSQTRGPTGSADARTGSKNGSADVTPTAPEPPASPSASPAASAAATHAATKELQRQLTSVGCYTGAVDGVAGPRTAAAVSAFQKAKGLQVDGRNGPATTAMLRQSASAGEAVCDARTVTESKPPTAAPYVLCNDEDVVAALKSDGDVVEYTCGDSGGEHWAAGRQSSGADFSSFFLKARGSKWVVVPNDEACGDEISTALPAQLLKYCGVGPLSGD